MKRDHVELEKELNKIFQKKGYPGMAVSIRGPEGILFEKGFGIRNGDRGDLRGIRREGHGNFNLHKERKARPVSSPR